jgi:hypothetical protein
MEINPKLNFSAFAAVVRTGTGPPLLHGVRRGVSDHDCFTRSLQIFTYKDRPVCTNHVLAQATNKIERLRTEHDVQYEHSKLQWKTGLWPGPFSPGPAMSP